MTFQPGKSGNPGGRPKTKIWREALVKAIGRVDEETGIPLIDITAEACVRAARAGDVAAMKEIGDRIDGKVPQANILMGDEEGGAVRYETVERVIVKPDAANTNGGSIRAIPIPRAV